MDMPGRNVGSDYHYGMNGQLHDDEVFEGFMSADYWGYDSRLGRRWEMDPIVRPWESSYATFKNNPVYYCDPSGLEGGPAKLNLDLGTSQQESGNGEGDPKTPPRPANGQKFKIIQRDFNKAISQYKDRSARYVNYGKDQYFSFTVDKSTNTTYVENIFNFNMGEAGQEYYSFMGEWEKDDDDSGGNNPPATGTDDECIDPQPPIPPPIKPRRPKIPPVLPPPIILPNIPADPPCIALSKVVELDWQGCKPIPKRPAYWDVYLRSIGSQWQVCHQTIIITINTPYDGTDKGIPNKDWFYWAPEAVMKARANYILGRLSLSGKIPASAIRNAIIQINYSTGGPGSQNGKIEFHFWDPENNVWYKIKGL
jgi:hypothetical protein